jgi:hypothetical protein
LTRHPGPPIGQRRPHLDETFRFHSRQSDPSHIPSTTEHGSIGRPGSLNHRYTMRIPVPAARVGSRYVRGPWCVVGSRELSCRLEIVAPATGPGPGPCPTPNHSQSISDNVYAVGSCMLLLLLPLSRAPASHVVLSTTIVAGACWHTVGWQAGMASAAARAQRCFRPWASTSHRRASLHVRSCSRR